MHVEAWLARAARIAPARIALRTPDASLSYGQLWRAAVGAAGELAERGARRGEPVAIALPAGADFAVALHACLLLGAVAVPIDLRLTAAERERAAVGASVLVDSPLAGERPQVEPAEGGEEVDSPLAGERPQVESAEGGEEVDSPLAGERPQVESAEGGGGSGLPDFDSAAAVSNTPPVQSNTPPVQDDTPHTHDNTPLSLVNTPPSRVNTPPCAGNAVAQRHDHPYTHDLDAVCAIIHTSGTTSQPRPVGLTYGNFLWSALGSGVALGVDPNELWLCTLPLAHVGGLSILVRSAIYATTAAIHDRFETERALAALRHEGVTLVSLVATTLARLLDAGLHDPPRLRWALTGGGPVPDALVQRARAAGVPVATTYGLTEGCSQVSTNGPPLFCSRVRIAPDGEILLAGPTVAPGAPAPDGWLHTGDLGRLDAEGNLRVVGRAAETIVSGGENVSPSEVEAVLESHPEVLEAAVVGREDPHWGEAVTAIVVLREPAVAVEGPLRGGDVDRVSAEAGAGRPVASGDGDRTRSLDEAALRAHCAARLAPFKVPKRVMFATAPLPRTRSGKLLRREL